MATPSSFGGVPKAAASRRERDPRKLAETVIATAFRPGVTDVHVRPDGRGGEIVCRLDGAMVRLCGIASKKAYNALVFHLKRAVKIDRSATAGHGLCQWAVGRQRREAWVQALRSVDGQEICVRPVRSAHELPSLSSLGVSDEEGERMMGLFRKPQGVLIVGSPTVSAFNVGLCAILNAGIQQHGSRSNVAVVAEYVPYRFDHTTMFLGPHADRRELRATMVRVVSQVFDTIVLAGHDQEAVASEAFKAAQRDRLVIPVLGGRDALGCVERCTAAGADAWAMSQYLIGVIFFEVLLANCPQCRARYAPDRRVLSGLGLAASKRWASQRGVGCKACDGTGYHGFVCVPQILEVDEALAAKLAASAVPAELRKTATASGLRPLKNLALAKARQGILPLEDVWLRFVKQRHCDH